MMHLFSRYRWHVLLWAVYFVFWTFFAIYTYGSTPGLAILGSGVWFLTQASASYCCIYWLIPRFFAKKDYLTFIGLFVLLLLLTTCLIGAGMQAVYAVGHAAAPRQSPMQNFFYLLMDNTFMIFFVVALKLIKDKLHMDNHTALLEKERTDSELRFLRSQMNPHFLFNAINSIYGLIKVDQDLAGHSLVRFADMLRYQIYECNTDCIPIEKEIAYLDNYIGLEKLRRGHLVETRFSVCPATEKFSIAPLLLITFVENAFKYVSVCSDKQNFVTVDLHYQDNIFEMSVENTMDEDMMASTKKKAWGGIGLENVRRRLQLLYDGRHALDIDVKENIYSVLLTIKVS